MINPEKILQSLDLQIIDDLVARHFEDDDYLRDGNTTKQIGVIAESALVTGYDYLLKQMTKKLLEDMEKGEDISNPLENRTRTKAVMGANLTKLIDDEGLVQFLEKKDDDLVVGIAEKLGLEVDGDKEDIVSRIENFLSLQGLRILFEAFPPKTLAQWCEWQDIDCESGSKNRLALALIHGEDLEEGPAKKRVVRPKKKKPPVEPGVNSVDLMHHYNVSELQEYCEQNKIKKSGRKREVVNRILKHLAGEDVPAPGRNTKTKKGGKKKV